MGVIVAVDVGVDVGVFVIVDVAVGVDVGGPLVSVGGTAVLVGGGVGDADCNRRVEEQAVATTRIRITMLILINDFIDIKSVVPKNIYSYRKI